ncbi:MAG: hypothetical protein Q9202_000356 [Teloschistes flavicans]
MEHDGFFKDDSSEKLVDRDEDVLKTGDGVGLSTTLKAAFALATLLTHHLPPLTFIAGPTWMPIMNRFALVPAATALSFLRDVESEQALLTKHSHAPLKGIRRASSDDDRATYDEAMYGLGVNWLPGWQRRSDDDPAVDAEEAAANLRLTRTELDSDHVAELRCGLISETEANVNIRYDDCQESAEEAERAVRVFGICANWMCHREN